MKKSLLTLAIAAGLLAGCSGSGPLSNKLKQVDSYYEIDTWGSNSEIYEFTPENAPEKLCVLFLTDSTKATAMQCFDKVK
jgi:hypothetical protein